MPRAKSNGAPKPVLDFEEEVIRKPLANCLVDVNVQEKLKMYPEYLRSLNKRKPSTGELVEKALANVFRLDAGFNDWYASQNQSSGK